MTPFQGVFEVDKNDGIVMTEIGDDLSVEDVQKATGCKLNISPNLRPMQQA